MFHLLHASLELNLRKKVWQFSFLLVSVLPKLERRKKQIFISQMGGQKHSAGEKLGDNTDIT